MSSVDEVVPPEENEVPDGINPDQLWEAMFKGDRSTVRRMMRGLPPHVFKTVLEAAGVDVPPDLVRAATAATPDVIEEEPASRARVRPRAQQAVQSQQRGPAARTRAAAPPPRRPARTDDLVFEDGGVPPEEEADDVDQQVSVQDLLNEIGQDVGMQIGGYPGVALGFTFHPRGDRVSISAFYPATRSTPVEIITQVSRVPSGRLGDAVAGILDRVENQLAAASDEDEDEDDDGDGDE